MTLEEFQQRWKRQDFYRKSSREDRGQLTYDQHLLEERVIACEEHLIEVREGQRLIEEHVFEMQETLKRILERLSILQ